MRIEVGHGHAAPFIIDMFVYRMTTPYCTKFDRLTNRKFMEIVSTRGQILMAKCTPSAPRPSRLRRSSRRLRRLDPSLLTPSAFGCRTEAKAHPTSSFWRRHCFVALGSVSSVPTLNENEIIRGTSHGPVFVCPSQVGVLLKRLNVGLHNALR